MNIADKADKRFKEILISNNPIDQMDDVQDKVLESIKIIDRPPLPFYLKPYFVTLEQKEMFENVTSIIMSAVEKMGNAFFKDPQIKQLLNVKGGVADFIDADPGYPNRHIVVRLDAFFSPDTQELKVIEFNCDDPSCMGNNDSLTGIFMGLQCVRALQEEFDIQPNILLDGHLELLEKKYLQFCESKAKPISDDPLMAIVCGRDSSIRDDVAIIVDTYQKKGVRARYADPRDFEYDGKTLFLNGECVDVVYRDTSTDFFREERKSLVKKIVLYMIRNICMKSSFWDKHLHKSRLGHNQHILNAISDGNVCLVNPFSSCIGGFKIVLAIMHDERFHYLFDEQELGVIKQHIPWTRILRKANAQFHGQKIALVDFVKENKDLFVLKTNIGYGGYGVTMGFDTANDDWIKKIDTACGSADDYIVQELVTPPHEEFPVRDKRKFRGFESKNVNINFWAFDGVYGGAFVRASDKPVINVHSGGGLVPVFSVNNK